MITARQLLRIRQDASTSGCYHALASAAERGRELRSELAFLDERDPRLEVLDAAGRCLDATAEGVLQLGREREEASA